MTARLVEGLAPCDQPSWRAIEEIFFASATNEKTLNEEARSAFFHRWTDYYRHHEAERILVYKLADRQIAGYLTGCFSSRAAKPLYRLIESYSQFEPHFDRFPAHFHINCRPDQRSRGFGTALVQHFLAVCRDSELPGVHVVTAAGARNVTFYRRLGFTPIDERRSTGVDRLLLGLRLG